MGFLGRPTAAEDRRRKLRSNELSASAFGALRSFRSFFFSLSCIADADADSTSERERVRKRGFKVYSPQLRFLLAACCVCILASARLRDREMMLVTRMTKIVVCGGGGVECLAK